MFVLIARCHYLTVKWYKKDSKGEKCIFFSNLTSILVEEGTLKEKVYNKQKIYVYNQALFPEVQKSQIKELDLRINDAKIKLQEIQHKVSENIF